MDRPILEEANQSNGLMRQLINTVSQANVKIIEIPLLGKSKVENTEEMLATATFLNELENDCDRNKIEIAVEVSLDPQGVVDFFSYIKNPYVKINYDTGNSAYWSFDHHEEFKNYGHLIGNVHIKDCTPELYSVPLGKGNVDFDSIFSYLKKQNYSKDFILQTARGEDDLALAKEYYKFSKPLIEQL